MGESRLQPTIDNQELEDSFKNLYLDDDGDGAAGTTGGAAGTAGAGSSGARARAGSSRAGSFEAGTSRTRAASS